MRNPACALKDGEPPLLIDLKDKCVTEQQSSILVLNSFHYTRQKKKKGFRVLCLSA